jgi:molecular chaperone Hsp33
MNQDDQLLSLNFEGFSVRGALVRLEQSWQAVRVRNPSPEPVQELLGQALGAAALLTSNIKFEGQVGLQLRGEGPVQLMLTQCTDQGGLRGIVRSANEVPVGASFKDLTRDAVLTVSIEQRGGQRSQGMVPISGNSLADSLQEYFQRSEQLQTQLWLASDEHRVAGLLLQQLPCDDETAVDPDGWNRVLALAETLKSSELLGLPGLEIARRLFHEESISTDILGLGFYCPCSRKRVAQVLTAIGKSEILEALGEKNEVMVDCEFCNERQTFDRVDLEALFNPRSVHGPDETRQ